MENIKNIISTQNKETLKRAIKSLKEDLKKNVELQREYKRHRKSEHFTGERMKVVLTETIWNSNCYSKDKEYTLIPDLAIGLHRNQRWYLRAMNAAYGLLRGKTLMQIENSFSKFEFGEDYILTEELHPLLGYKTQIEKYVIKYLNEGEKENEETVCTD